MGTSLNDLGKNFKEAGKASKESGLFGLGGGLDVLFNGTDRQLKDVDSLIPKIDKAKAEQYIKDLDYHELNGDLKQYLDTLKDGEQYVSDYAHATLGQKRVTDDLMDSNIAARQAIIDENDAIKESTFRAKISNSFASIGKSALALAGNIGVSLLVAGAINEIGEAWINYSQKQEKAIETGDKVLTTHKKNLEEFSNASSVVDEVGERFVKLQEGVRNGQNISLTNDEFEEYKNLASELSSVLPDLVSGYDSLGNPIINSVKSMGDLNNVLKEQKQLLNQQNINNAKDYVDAFNAQSSQLKTGNQQEQGFAQRQKLLDAMVSQINSDKAKGINTNFSDYMTQSDAFTGFQAFANDVSNSIKEFASDHPIIGGFLDNIWNAEPTMVQARNNRKLGSNFAKSFQDNSVMLDDIKSSMDVSKMSAEDMTNEMLNYNLGMKKILEDAGINLDEINQIYKDSEKLSGKEKEQKLDDYNTALENANKQIAQMQKTNLAEWNAAFNNTKPLIESMLQGEDNGMNYNLLQDTTKSALSQIVNGMDVKAAQSIGLIGEDGSMDTKSIKSWADGIAQNIKSSGAEEALNDLFTLQENKNDLGFKEYSNQVDSLVNDISSKVPELSGDLLKSTSGISDSLSDLKHQRVALMNDGFSERLLNDLSNADLEILWKLNSEGMVDGIENAKQAIADYKKALEDNDPNKYFNAWTEATSSANEGAKYNAMLSGYEAAKEAYESGEVGTDDFKTFAAMISPTGSDDARNFAENYPKFERYFQEGKTGVENFLNDLSTLQTTTGEKMASLGDDGNWDFNVTDINDVAQKLGVGSEMVGALFGRLRDFGYDNSIITSAEEGGKRIGELITNLEKEKDRNEKLTSITGENEQGYNTTAGDHTFGNQTSIDESNAKIKQYNEGIVETINNTKDLIRAQNDSEKAQQKAAISAAKALKEQKDLAEQAGLYDTADLIQGQIEQLGTDFGIENINAEVNFDVSEATDNAQDLIDKIWEMKDRGADTSNQMNTLADTIKQVGEHDGDITTLVSEFNGLAEATNAAFRMDESGNQFNVADKISQVQQLADKATLLSTKGSDASDTLASMADGIQTLSAANVDVSNLVGLYNSLAKSTGLDNRMELTGEIVSVDEYSGEMPTVPAKVTINADVSGAEGVENLTQSLSSIPKGTTATVNVDVSGEEDVSNLTSSMESVPDNTPVTISCTVENQEQLDQITQKASELNAQGKQITIDAKIGNVDTASLLDGSNKTVDIKGKITDIDTSAVENKEVTLKGKIEFENPDGFEPGGTKGNSLIDTSSNVIQKKVEFTADTSGVDPFLGELTAEDIQKTVTVNEEKGTEVTNEQPEAKTQVVNEEKGTDVTSEQPEPITQEVNREVNDGETSQEPAPVEQLVNRKVDNTIQLGVGDSQQGGVITYQSKVEPPEVPDVQGKTVIYKSKVQKPVIPDVEGKTVTYKVNVESASVPTLEGTVNYKGNFPTSAPVLDGTVNYSANFSGEVSAASGTANFTLGNSPKEVPPAQGIANFSLGSSPTTVPPASGVANFSLGSYPTSLPAITQTVIANKVGFASGTMLSPAHVDGTAYNVINYKSAYADGEVSLPHDEKALVNELGILYAAIFNIENLFNCWEPLRAL